MAVTVLGSRTSPQWEHTGTALVIRPQVLCLTFKGGPSGAAQRSPHCLIAVTTCQRSRPLSVSRYSERGGWSS